jgi:XapX domain-containing protein
MSYTIFGGMDIMKAYLLSLALGVLVGAIYNLSSVRSPAPPTIALVGLLGMLAGEHILAALRASLTHVGS